MKRRVSTPFTTASLTQSEFVSITSGMQHFLYTPPPMLERIMYTLTTWHISVLMKTEMLHSANMFMRKEHLFNIYILPSKICTFCKLFFWWHIFVLLPIHCTDTCSQNDCLKQGTFVTGNSRSEEPAWASFLGSGSLGLPRRGEYLLLLMSLCTNGCLIMSSVVCIL